MTITFTCPFCGVTEPECKYTYKGMPIHACDDCPKDMIYTVENEPQKRFTWWDYQGEIKSLNYKKPYWKRC